MRPGHVPLGAWTGRNAPPGREASELARGRQADRVIPDVASDWAIDLAHDRDLVLAPAVPTASSGGCGAWAGFRAYLPDWIDVALAWQPLVAALEGRHAVSVCGSVRRTGEAHEAGVDTAPAFRRRGHAHRAVAAWLVEVKRLGREPLYSTSWQNAASQALAASLGLTMFGTDFAVM
jgi:RimJ/RimL family protein N-acetyltransferase